MREVLVELGELENIGGKGGVILGGNGGGEVIGDRVRGGGGEVSFCECYEGWGMD